MPLLSLITNIDTSPEEQIDLRNRLSSFMAEQLNKPEDFCMTITQFGIGTTFGGSEEPTASLELSSLGLEEDLLPELTQLLCHFLEETLNLDPKRIYIRYTSPERSHWGWNGKTFG